LLIDILTLPSPAITSLKNGVYIGRRGELRERGRSPLSYSFPLLNIKEIGHLIKAVREGD
jgi:hypothetical protein